jgi:hypothetical protein
MTGVFKKEVGVVFGLKATNKPHTTCPNAQRHGFLPRDFHGKTLA